MEFKAREFYTLKDGTKIELGMQNLEKGTVPVRVDGEVFDAPMGNREDGEFYFIVREEEILFHWISTRLDIHGSR